MGFFPDTVMPKRLRKETSYEVDGSPAIYNAKDYNTHHREILAIERALIGHESDNPISLEKAVSLLESLLDQLTVGGLVTASTGIIIPGSKIPISAKIVNTMTRTATAADATTINVESTVGFATNGYITKINALPLDGSGQYVLNPISLTYQEIISYTSITSNSFLGCTRAMFGTDAQALPYTSYVPIAGNDGTKAVIIGGRASFSYYPIRLDVGEVSVKSIVLNHEADLTLGMTVSDVSPLTNNGAIGYSLMVVGQLPNVDLSSLFVS